MHHEVLLALAGHLGDVIVRRAPSPTSPTDDLWACGVATFPWVERGLVSRPESDMINRTVGELSARYRELSAFIEEEQNGARYSEAAQAKGFGSNNSVASSMLYMEALIGAISCVLDEYRGVLCDAEQEVLRDPTLPLSALMSGIASARGGIAGCLSLLCSVVKELRGANLRGGQLLNALHAFAQSHAGIPRAKTCLEDVSHALHLVMYGLMESWMLHGLLVDAEGEFFVKRNVYRVQLYDPTGGAPFVEGRWKRRDARRERRDADRCLQANFEWQNEFTLDLSMFPSSYVKLDVAEKVLFVGKAMRVLQHPSASRRADRDEIQNMVTDFARKFAALKQRRPFRAIHLETFVKEVHAAVAEKLWKLIVVDADLVQHLKFIRHFFLLGKGEFYRSFIDNSRRMLAAPPQKDLRRSEAAVNLGPWKRAAEMCGLGDMSDDDDNDASGNDYEQSSIVSIHNASNNNNDLINKFQIFK